MKPKIECALKIQQKLKPAVPKKILLIISGAMWCCVGLMLSSMAFHWLNPLKNRLYFAIPGFLAALVIHHFGFIRIVDKNLGRISQLPGKPCVFSFISWKSYLTIIIMVTMGIALRHSGIPKQYLSMLYLGIGLALLISSIKYFRNIFFSK